MIEHYEFDEQIRTAVAAAIRPYLDYVEHEDALQEAYAYWYDEYFQERAEKATDVQREIYLVRNHVLDFCRQQKRMQTGFDPRDELRYNAQVIRKLIPVALFGHHPSPIVDGERVSGKSDPAIGGDVLVMIMDIRDQLEQLDRDELELVAVGAAADGEWSFVSQADPATAKRSFNRIVRKIQEGLGGEPEDFYEGPGSRQAVSNAAAKAGRL